MLVEKGEKFASIGQTITIKLFGANQSVIIEILADNGEVIYDLETRASSQGEVNLPWIVPKDTEPGIYTVRATDAVDSSEATFEVE